MVFQQRQSFWKMLNVGEVAFINSEIVLNKHFLCCHEPIPDNNRKHLYVLCVFVHMLICTHMQYKTGEKLV